MLTIPVFISKISPELENQHSGKKVIRQYVYNKFYYTPQNVSRKKYAGGRFRHISVDTFLILFRRDGVIRQPF